jgi:chromosome segregation ATPase
LQNSRTNDDNGDIIAQSLKAAEMLDHNNCETTILQLQSELEKTKKDLAYSEKLRSNYYTNHWVDKKNYRLRISDLKEKITCLEGEKKSAEADLNLFERMVCEKDRKISHYENLLSEKEKKINNMENEYQELLNHFINLKVSQMMNTR